ncbi:interferon-induced helicase C domain-containing protein 1 [Pelodytes ibericus]
MTATSSEEIHLNMIQCFQKRLVGTIQVAPVLDHLTLLDMDMKAQVRHERGKHGDQRAANLLLDLIVRGPRNPGWFEEFVRALKDTECSQAALYLTPEQIPSPAAEEKYDQCEQLIQLLYPTLIQVMIPEEIAPKCFQKGICSNEDMEVITAVLRQHGQIEASRELLTRITKKLNWFPTFVTVLRDVGSNDLVQTLTGEMPDSNGMDQAQGETLDTQEERTDRAVLTEEENGQQKVATDDIAGTLHGESTAQSDLDSSFSEISINRSTESNENTSESDDEYSSERASSIPEITLRDYQMEVAKPALEGSNIIICLPTGSGKTRVAVYITREHLERRKRQGLPAKAIVLVNKVPLVEQHYGSEFHPFLKDRYKIIKISGESLLKITFAGEVKKNDVIICTAQILENSLNKAAEDEEECVKLSDFSLIIIDECHHTQKDDVFNNIMVRYIKKKERNIIRTKMGKRPIALPQILGLTASPGVGGAKNIKEATEHILQICANLDADNIMTVQENISQLENQVKEPYKKIEIADEKKKNPFGNKIKSMMEKIQDYGDLCPTTDFGSQSFEQWVVQKGKSAAKEGNRKVHVCAEHLKKYNDALMIYDTIRVTDALAHLTQFYTEENKKKILLSECSDREEATEIDETDKFLLDLFYSHKEELEKMAGRPDYENAKLASLRKSIMEEFTRNRKARGIIFTKTRQSAVALHQWIAENEKFVEVGLRSHYLIGAGHNSDFKAMTQNEQKQVINKFSTGEINLLVATSVAEEGLDIKECNIVILYGLVMNEIGMVQARGRARDDDSTYVLVTGSSSGAVERDSVNVRREKMMHKAIQKVQKMNHADYLEKIKERQSQNIVEKKVKKMKKMRKTYQSAPGMVTFHCKKCHKLACSGDDIQVIEQMHHVNTAKSFRDLFTKGENKTLQEKSADYQTNWEIICKNCGKTWGTMMVHRGLDLPCLKIINFVVKYKAESMTPDTLAQWSDLPIRFPAFKYTVPILSSDDDDDDD